MKTLDSATIAVERCGNKITMTISAKDCQCAQSNLTATEALELATTLLSIEQKIIDEIEEGE